MTKRLRASHKNRARLAQLKVRLPESVRKELEHAAAQNGRSMNAEIVQRLAQPFRELDPTNLIADAVLNGLSAAVVASIIKKATASEGVFRRSSWSDTPPLTLSSTLSPTGSTADTSFGQSAERASDVMSEQHQASVAEIARRLLSRVKADDLKQRLQELSQLPSAEREWLPFVLPPSPLLI
jgi:hypothetical protein